jgi:heme O synthase-like polyprenyltransferase
MPNSPIIIALLAFSLGACVFAFLKGEAAERIGAGIILLNMLLALAGEYYFPRSILLWLDALTALSLLVVAVFYASPWLGAVMLLYAAQFTLHAVYFVAARPRDHFHVVANNIDFFLISLCLVIGTALTWRRRARGAPPA